jgi:hypothetical protein
MHHLKLAKSRPHAMVRALAESEDVAARRVLPLAGTGESVMVELRRVREVGLVKVSGDVDGNDLVTPLIACSPRVASCRASRTRMVSGGKYRSASAQKADSFSVSR